MLIESLCKYCKVPVQNDISCGNDIHYSGKENI